MQNEREFPILMFTIKRGERAAAHRRGREEHRDESTGPVGFPRKHRQYDPGRGARGAPDDLPPGGLLAGRGTAPRPLPGASPGAGIWQLRLFPGLPGRGEAAVPRGQAGAAMPRAHLRRKAVSAGGGTGGGGTGSGPLSLRPHPQAPGGQTGKNAVSEPRQHRGLRPAHVWHCDPGEREAGRADGAAARLNGRFCGIFINALSI